MPRAFAPGTISAISPSNGKSVDVNALNFLLLGETDFNSKNPDNQLGPIGAGGAYDPIAAGVAGANATFNATILSFNAQFNNQAEFERAVFGPRAFVISPAAAAPTLAVIAAAAAPAPIGLATVAMAAASVAPGGAFLPVAAPVANPVGLRASINAAAAAIVGLVPGAIPAGNIAGVIAAYDAHVPAFNNGVNAAATVAALDALINAVAASAAATAPGGGAVAAAIAAAAAAAVAPPAGAAAATNAAVAAASVALPLADNLLRDAVALRAQVQLLRDQAQAVHANPGAAAIYAAAIAGIGAGAVARAAAHAAARVPIAAIRNSTLAAFAATDALVAAARAFRDALRNALIVPPGTLSLIKNAVAAGGCDNAGARAYNQPGAVRNYPIYSPAASVWDAKYAAEGAARASPVPAISGAAAAIGRAAGDAAELAYAILYKNLTAAGVRQTNNTDEARFEADNEAARILQKVFDRFTASNLAARTASNSLQAVAGGNIAARALVPATAAPAGAASIPAIVGISARNVAAVAAGVNQNAVDGYFEAAAKVAEDQRNRELGAGGSGGPALVGPPFVPARAQAFAHHICYFNDFYSNIGRPTTIEELIATLRKNFSGAFNQFLKQGDWKDKSVTASSFIAQFEKSIGSKITGAPSFSSPGLRLDDYAPHFQELKHEFTLNEIQQPVNGFIAPQAQLNSANLHVALLYPGVAQYLKKVRSKLLNNAYAVRSPFFPNMSRGGISFQIQTGGNNIQNLNSAYPIEMRGYGHLIASSMKGGNLSGLSIGTINSPTIWRPLTDDSYIGDSLVTAATNVKAKLQALNITLDPLVDQKIAGRLNDLRNAEQAAKNYRDKLNIVARINGQGTGDGQVDWTNAGRNANAVAGQINDNDVDKLVDDYNRSMQQVVKNEGVVLKVLDQLGRVVAEHRVGS